MTMSLTLRAKLGLMDLCLDCCYQVSDIGYFARWPIRGAKLSAQALVSAETKSVK